MMAAILNPNPAPKTAPPEKTFDSLDRGLHGLGLGPARATWTTILRVACNSAFKRLFQQALSRETRMIRLNRTPPKT